MYLHIGLFEKANEQFREAETVDSGARTVRLNIGQILTYQGHPEEGLRAIREVPRESQTSMWAANVAWNLLYLGRSDEARPTLRTMKSDPADPGGQVSGVRAILDAKKGDARKMEKDIQKAVALGQGYGHFHHTAYNIASAYALLR